MVDDAFPVQRGPTHFSGPLTPLTLTNGTTVSYDYVTVPGDVFCAENVLSVTWLPLAAVPEPPLPALLAIGVLFIASAREARMSHTSA